MIFGERFTLITLLAVALIVVCVYGISEPQQENWKNTHIALITKQGVPVDYYGYKIVYEKNLTENGNFLIVMDISGRKTTINPGRGLGIRFSNKGWGFSPLDDDDALTQFAFYLPDGEKLRLKAVSSDLLDLYWTKET